VIPYFDYRPALAAIRTEIDAAIARVLDSGRLILGPEVAAFEREFATWVGGAAAVPEGVGVGSGTDALLLALRALEVGPGDEVITVANAGVPTIAAIRAAGAIPRFVDIDRATHLLDPAGLERARTSKTRCVIPIHLYGQSADLEAIGAFAARHDLRVIEDCAQAHGALYRGRHVGTFGDVGCFSFYPTKNLGALGDAGLAITSNAEIAGRLRALRMYGYDADRHARREGLNSRLDELQAAVLRVKLAHLDVELEARRTLAAQYQQALKGTAYRCLETAPGNTHAFHLFVIEAPDRSRAIEALRRAEIGSAIHYPVPVHRMDAYAFLGCAEGSLPVTEAAAQVVLSLPLYPGLVDTEVSKVVSALSA